MLSLFLLPLGEKSGLHLSVCFLSLSHAHDVLLFPVTLCEERLFLLLASLPIESIFATHLALMQRWKTSINGAIVRMMRLILLLMRQLLCM